MNRLSKQAVHTSAKKTLSSTKPCRACTMNRIPPRLLLLSFLLVSLLVGFAKPIPLATARTKQEVSGAAPVAERLETGTSIKRELSQNTTLTFAIELKAGQFFSATLEQFGLWTKTLFLDPEGKPTGFQAFGQERYAAKLLAFEALHDGTYRLTIECRPRSSPAAHLILSRIQKNVVTAADRQRLTGLRLCQEAQKLTEQEGEAPARQALPLFEQALTIWRELGEKNQAAQTCLALGFAYESLGDRSKAMEWAASGVALLGPAESQALKAFLLRYVGRWGRASGKIPAAVEAYENALTIWKSLGEIREQAEELKNLGYTSNTIGDDQKALEYYRQAERLSSGYQDAEQQASLWHNMGMVFDAAGDRTTAIDYYNRSLKISSAEKLLTQQAYTLTTLGAVYFTLGERQKALDAYNTALPIQTALNNRPGKAQTLNYLGMLFKSSGEFDKSQTYFNQALELAQAGSDPYGEAYALTNLGQVYWSQGNPEETFRVYQQALDLAVRIKDRRQQAGTLTIMAVCHQELKNYAKAVELLNQALEIQTAINQRAGVAYTCQVLGKLYRLLGEYQKSEEFLIRSVNDQIAVGNMSGQAYSNFELAHLYFVRKEFQKAREKAELFLGQFEYLRSRTLSQESRTSFFTFIQEGYNLYLDILMDLHRSQPNVGADREAFLLSEKKRARILQEMLLEARAGLRNEADQGLLTREVEIQKQLVLKTQQLVWLRDPQKRKELETELARLTEDMKSTQEEIRAKLPRYAALLQPPPLTVEQIQKEFLTPETVLVEFVFTQQRTYRWVISPTSFSVKELDQGKVINDLVGQYKEELLRPRSMRNIELGNKEEVVVIRQPIMKEGINSVSQALSSALLGDVYQEIKGKKLIIVADSALHYVPFAALPEPVPADKNGTAPGDKTTFIPLIAGHELVMLPSVATLSVLRAHPKAPPAEQKLLAMIADPVFSGADARLKGKPVVKPTESAVVGQVASRNLTKIPALQTLLQPGTGRSEATIPRLPGTRTEATRILSLVPKQKSLALLDFAANPDSLAKASLKDYRIVHFATHGFVDSQNPDLSGLVLSLVNEKGEERPGLMLVPQIYNLDLAADLVVLSACRTGLGKEVVGEGLVGLTRAFMYAGTPRVLVSLWNVSDTATSELMTRFYHALLKEGKTPAAALREAQLELVKDRRWHHPYYWAAFQLQGDFR
ncbi:MAG: CHAT domain-containing protein [Blastocatellia bacterium]|nr:CHAT domain-containing protein [Blastocatellia bacterium]